MADLVSVRSRSVRSTTRSTAHHQTGTPGPRDDSSERLLPERGRQDHAGQHGSIVEGPELQLRINQLRVCNDRELRRLE